MKRNTWAQALGIILAVCMPFALYAADVGTGAPIKSGSPIMLQSPDAGATPMTTDLLQASGQGVWPGARIAVSHTTPTLMTAGATGYRKAISLQNFDTTQGLYCGFNASITINSAPIYVPAKSSGTPGPWSADMGLATSLYCLAETSTQVSPADTGVVEAK